MLSVVLGKTTPVYSPGDTLLGDVVITTTTQCKILDLTVNYCGISSVSFLISEGEGKSRTCGKAEESDIHLDVLHPLIKYYRGVVIEAGVHTYPFSLKLSEELPSSYKSPYGYVTYYVHVHLQMACCTLDVNKPFTVLAPVNINLFPASHKPKCAEIVKNFGLIQNKVLKIKASVSKTCFVPGDIISVYVEVDNETSRELRYLFCTLKQTTTVLVHLQDKIVDRVTKQCVQTVAHKLTDSRGHHSWLCQLNTSTLLIPTIAASSIVFVTYSIQVSAKIKGVKIPPDVQIPIVFGIRAPIPIPVPKKRIRVQSECSEVAYTRYASYQTQPSIHIPIQRRTADQNLSVTNISKLEETSVTRKRRVTVSTQPQFSFNNPTKSVSSHLQSIASDLTRRISSQLQLGFIGSAKQFNCES